MVRKHRFWGQDTQQIIAQLQAEGVLSQEQSLRATVEPSQLGLRIRDLFTGETWHLEPYTSTAETLTWIVDETAYECVIHPAACPSCGVPRTVTELPPPLKAQQADGTTHVCHPSLGGCNHGFTLTRVERSPS